ncbi:HAMP domain-containing protein [Streptomyces sp. SID1034]|uniref:HAMP domain-containing protein n=1 Tax=Streptomyces sp. SID1034 TaxID=2690248 RepID=UPI001369906F|nr:HAMP domain-containing protein [Streptomyces sp. SID1034]MYV93771.1 HAMP domain-containing protein [Streptomyces sp. SID1034]MYV93790.1 HAMP domain-containing protein [Streptomyces sp. SID1034]
MPLLGGIRPPIAVLCILILALSGLTAKVLGPAGDTVVPKAVLSSQRYFAEDGAIALRSSIDERVADLQRTATAVNSGSSVKPERVLSDLSRAYQKWTGTTVLDLESGEVLAARGETIPLAWLDEDTLTGGKALKPRIVRLETGDVRLMTMVVLEQAGQPQQLLVASSSLTVPAINLGPFRSMSVVAEDGEVLATAGFERAESLNSDQERAELSFRHQQMTRLADQAAKRAEQHPVRAKEPGARGYPGVSGTLLGGEHNGRVATVGYASLASSDPDEKQSVAAGLGLSVVSLLPVVRQEAGQSDRALLGLAAAGALVLLGLVAVAVLWRNVQRPLLHLFLESRRLARGDLHRPVSVPKRGEAARIGIALERLRRRLTGDDPAAAPPAARRRMGTRGPLVITGVLLLLWCVPVGLLLNRTDATVSVPTTIVNDQRERTDMMADRLRRALNEAQADLVSVSHLIEEGNERGTDSLLNDALAKHSRYQSLYVVDPSGAVSARAGGEPHAWSNGEDQPEVQVGGKGGKLPILQASAPVSEGKGGTLVGEIRVQFLNSLLVRPGLGEVRVMDADGLTIASSGGFTAFEKLPGEALDNLVRAANVRVGAGPVENGLLIRGGGKVTVAAAAPFSGGGVTADIGWTLVSRQDAGHLRIAPYEREDRSVLAGLLGLAAVIVCLGWIHLVVVRPLRALATSAEKLADGDLKTVLYPRYQDEVGAVVRSLELLRQQAQAHRQNPTHRTADPRVEGK